MSTKTDNFTRLACWLARAGSMLSRRGRAHRASQARRRACVRRWFFGIDGVVRRRPLSDRAGAARRTGIDSLSGRLGVPDGRARTSRHDGPAVAQPIAARVSRSRRRHFRRRHRMAWTRSESPRLRAAMPKCECDLRIAPPVIDCLSVGYRREEKAVSSPRAPDPRGPRIPCSRRSTGSGRRSRTRARCRRAN